MAEVTPRLALSRRGAGFIKAWETCRLAAYPDEKGVWTIGWGHTGSEVIEGLTWTQQQADDAFTRDTIWAVNAVNDLVLVALSQCQFDALCSLVFNIGKPEFFTSTLLAKLNRSDYTGARNQFLVWNKETRDGKLCKSNGLTRRRNAEAMLWDSV